MNKIIILLMLITFTSTNAVKAQSYETEYEETAPTVSRQHHLNYKGISMGGTIDYVRYKLKCMGMRFISDNPKDDSYATAEFEKGILEGNYLTIKYNKSSKSVSSFSISTFARIWEDAKPTFEKILKDISNDYPNALFDVGVFKNEYGSTIEKYCWKVLSDDNKYILGSIYVTLDKNSTDPHYCADIKYYDYYNSMEADNVGFEDYDISSVMYPDYDNCLMYIDDDYLILYPTKNGKTTMVVAQGEDRKKIIKLLDTKNVLKSDIRPYITSYLNSMPIYNDKYICLTNSCFNNKDVYWGIGDDIEKMREQADLEEAKEIEAAQEKMRQKQIAQKNSSTSPMKEFMHGIYEGILGKELVDFYKQKGMYDGMFNLFDKLLPGIGGDGKTSWDLLNDAQKSVIHEHDNAR